MTNLMLKLLIALFSLIAVTAFIGGFYNPYQFWVFGISVLFVLISCFELKK